jgi:hypothetical protein
MIRRTLDPAFLNSVANHEKVRPMIGGDISQPVDLTGHIQNLANICLVAEGGGWLLLNLAPGLYEAHTLFLPEARGKAYFRQLREALRWLFVQSDCVEIVTKCPDDNPGANMAAVIPGFRALFRRENAWAEGVGLTYYSFTIEDWFKRDAECPKAGKWFHDKIEAALGHENHPEDEIHDRAVGAAVLMMRAGLIGKAISFYNRWGLIAGYAPISQVGLNLIDIQTAILALQGEDLEVLFIRG